jgi:hypothetical protein
MIVDSRTTAPYTVPDVFVLERIEALTEALGGKPVPAASLTPRDDDWDEFDHPKT